MPEQAAVVELPEGLEPNLLSLPRHFEDAVHLQCVRSVCGTVRVANILLQQLVLLCVFVKGLHREERWNDQHCTSFKMAEYLSRPAHTHAQRYNHM